MSAMEKTKTNTNNPKKKCLKEKKSKIIGTKTKDKNETGKKLHYSFKKLQNFQVGENIQCLRNDKNKLVSHWLSLPLRRAIFGSWIIKLFLQHSEANSNKQSFHFNNVPFSSKHAVILFNVAIISYLHGEDLAIWLILVCTRTKCRSASFPHGSEQKRTGKTKSNIKNMLFETSELFTASPTKMRDVIMHPGGLQKSFSRIFNHTES